MTCRLIVCEKTNRWAMALRAALGRSPLQVVETRGLTACDAALAEAPASLVAIEITAANLEPAVDFVVQAGRRFPRALFVALVAEETADSERLMQEAGAVDVIGSVLNAPRVARVARRHFALAPPQELDVHELVRQRMPWAAHA